MKTLLSTKIVSPSQKELILNAGINFVEYDAVQVNFLPISFPKVVTNAIVTSQNAAQFILENHIIIAQCFCVGEKTESLLIKNGQKVIKKAQNSSELAHFITKTHKNDSFFYFCGTRRRPEIPSILKTEKVSFTEIVCYETVLQEKVFSRPWDGILFFSPSGVESFISSNSLHNSICFCIGDTTARTAQKYTQNVVIANTTTVESVIAKAVKTFITHD